MGTPSLLDDLGILVVNPARDRVEDDVVVSRRLLVQRSDGHQTTRATTGLRDEIRLTTRDPEIASRDEMASRLALDVACCKTNVGLRFFRP